MNTQPIKIVLPKPNYTWISSLSALLKSFQFLNSLKIPESNSCFAGDVFDIKAKNNSAIEYFSDSNDKQCCKKFVSKTDYSNFSYPKRN